MEIRFSCEPPELKYKNPAPRAAQMFNNPVIHAYLFVLLVFLFYRALWKRRSSWHLSIYLCLILCLTGFSWPLIEKLSDAGWLMVSQVIFVGLSFLVCEVSGLFTKRKRLLLFALPFFLLSVGLLSSLSEYSVKEISADAFRELKSKGYVKSIFMNSSGYQRYLRGWKYYVELRDGSQFLVDSHTARAELEWRRGDRIKYIALDDFTPPFFNLVLFGSLIPVVCVLYGHALAMIPGILRTLSVNTSTDL